MFWVWLFRAFTESYTRSSAECSEVEELKRVQKSTGRTVALGPASRPRRRGPPWNMLTLSREVEHPTSSDAVSSHAYITPHTHSRQPRQCCHGRRWRAHVPEPLSLQVVSCTQLAEADASRAGRSEAPPPVGLARAVLYHLRHLFCL